MRNSFTFNVINWHLSHPQCFQDFISMKKCVSNREDRDTDDYQNQRCCGPVDSALEEITQTGIDEGPETYIYVFANHQLSLNILRSNQRSEEHTSELQSRGHLVCRLLLEKKKTKLKKTDTD